MSFTFTESMLRKLCTVNSFSFPNSNMVFFGFRGCLPVNPDNNDFDRSHQLAAINFDHIHPRCTLGQWLPEEGLFSVFAGSTVPHIRYVKTAYEKGGKGANMMLTGYYTDYRKGRHLSSKPTGHDAFRQTGIHPIRRTADDLDYDEDDRVEIKNPFDNIHAAYCWSADSDKFGSAGCQVIVGYPKCTGRGNKDNVGPWKVFHDNAYGIDQTRFTYVLLSGFDAQRAANSSHKWKPRLRFGSTGTLVGTVQKSLKERGFYNETIDNHFGKWTQLAVMEYQEHEFGSDADDGIVGPMTARALDIDWIPED